MFDPYHKWLGIPKKFRPPTHYQLLGIGSEEEDAEVIEEAAIRQSAHLRTYQTGPQSELCTRLLNEISQARTVLLDPVKRKKYDAVLAQKSPGRTQAKPAATAPSVAAPGASEFADIQAAPTLQKYQHHGRNGGRGRDDASHRPAIKKKTNYLPLIIGGVAVAILGLVLIPVAIVAALWLTSRDVSSSNVPIAAKKVGDQFQVPKNNDPVKKPKLEPPDKGGQPIDVKPRDKEKPDPNPKQPPKKKFEPKDNLKPKVKPDPRNTGAKEISRFDRNSIIGDFCVLPGKDEVLFGHTFLEKVNLTTQEQLQVYGKPKGGSSHTVLRLSSDGTRFLWVQMGEPVIQIWDLARSEQIGRLDGQDSRFSDCFFLPDGKRVVSLQNRYLRVWNTDDQKEVFCTPRSKGYQTMAVTVDGKKALTLQYQSLEVWDLDRLQLAKQLPVPAKGTSCMSIAADGSYALSCSTGKFGILFGNLNSADTVFVPTGSMFWSMDYSPDGRFLVVGGKDGFMQVWDAKARQPFFQIFGHDGARRLYRVRFSPDGRHIWSSASDKTFRVWKLSEKALVSANPKPPPKKTKVKVKTLAAVKQFPTNLWVDSVRLLPMLKSSVLVGGTTLDLWNLDSNKTRQLVPRKSGGLNAALAVSPNGAVAAARIMEEQQISLWDLRGMRIFGLLPVRTGKIHTIVFTDNGRKLLSGSEDRIVRLWDVQSRKVLHEFGGHQIRVYGLDASADGRRAVSCSSDGDVRLWNLESRTPIRSTRMRGGGRCDVVFAPDGKCILYAGPQGGVVRLHAETLATLKTSETSNPASRINISSDGKFVVTCGNETTARVWDAESLQELYRLPHAKTASDAVFSSNNQSIVSCERNAVYVWRLPVMQKSKNGKE